MIECVVSLSVILFPPLLIAFLLVMERVEEPLRRPASPREVTEFLSTATAGEKAAASRATPREVSEFLNTATSGEVDTLAASGIRRALSRWRHRRGNRGRTSNPPLV